MKKPHHIITSFSKVVKDHANCMLISPQPHSELQQFLNCSIHHHLNWTSPLPACHPSCCQIITPNQWLSLYKFVFDRCCICIGQFKFIGNAHTMESTSSSFIATSSFGKVLLSIDFENSKKLKFQVVQYGQNFHCFNGKQNFPMNFL